MNKLIHDPTSHGQKVIFSTSDELAEWLSVQHAGILFAINKHATVVYTVIKMDGEAPWAVSSFNEFYSISFNKLINENDLYFIDNHQMIHLIETCEN
tara:strand:+ start:169 stop:459 length:291 start_codon:yes stop_codon:yes gene_type:complete